MNCMCKWSFQDRIITFVMIRFVDDNVSYPAKCRVLVRTYYDRYGTKDIIKEEEYDYIFSSRKEVDDFIDSEQLLLVR